MAIGLDGQLTSKLLCSQLTSTSVQRRFGGSLVQYSSKGTLYVYNDELIRLVVRAVITITSAVLLIIPIISLHFVQGRSQALVGVGLVLF